MLVFHKKSDLNAFLAPFTTKKTTIGFVPTMGALHSCHLSLIAKSASENSKTIVSIFVNPTQFNNSQDLAQYPQQLTADIALLKTISEDLLVFTPSVKEMYPEGLGAKPYSFNGLDRRWEGEDRTGHFQGVGTVVEKLFEMVRPNQAYFGEKDFQQLAIIRDLVRQKAFGISIVGCPIVRESYGLAMSSRNERLKPLDRVAAAVIYKTLKIAAQKALAQNLLSEITHEAIKEIHTLENTAVFYFEFVNARSLEPIKTLENPENTRIITAVNFKGVRLLDNIGL